jgi:putative membrane protein
MTTARPGSSGEPTPEEVRAQETVSYANERTFLAWVRTSLGLTTAGLAISQLLPQFGFAGGRRVVGLPLIALGIWAAAAAYRTWAANERAISAGLPITRSHLAAIVTGGVVLVGIVALVLAAIGTV